LPGPFVGEGLSVVRSPGGSSEDGSRQSARTLQRYRDGDSGTRRFGPMVRQPVARGLMKRPRWIPASLIGLNTPGNANYIVDRTLTRSASEAHTPKTSLALRVSMSRHPELPSH